MSGRVFLALLSSVRTQYGLNSRGWLSYRSYVTAQRVERVRAEKMDTILPYNEFKERYIANWESFKASPAVKTVCGNDLAMISKAYERFCLSQYSLYKHQAYGGNLSLMI